MLGKLKIKKLYLSCNIFGPLKCIFENPNPKSELKSIA
jgi:hypothetical protein